MMVSCVTVSHGGGQHRDVVIQLFTTKKSLRKSEIQAAVQQRLGAEMPGRLYNTVLRELASTTKGNQWTWKVGHGTD
jgi:hypothetical protein